MREISLHILDVMENSIEAGAKRVDLEIEEDAARNLLSIAVRDDGRGMDDETLRRVIDPFFTTRTTRHVGLGLPLFKAAAQRCNGDLEVASQLGQGTQVRATFQLDHIDRAPLGDLKMTLLSAILSYRASDVHYRHAVNGREFEFDTGEMRALLGDVPLDHPQVRAWLEEFLDEGISGLYRQSETLSEEASPQSDSQI
jgi:hypothetical protein